MRIATWNVNSLKARLPRVEEFLGYAEVDVLCLQETKLADKAFPALTFSALGYESVHHGQGQWNGVAILSRVGIADPSNGFGDAHVDPYEGDARVLAATCGGIRVVSVYVPNGREVATEFYERKLHWLSSMYDWIDATHTRDDPLVVMGDFNVAPDRPRRVGSEEVRRRDARDRTRTQGRRRASRSGASKTRSGACIPTSTGSTATGTTGPATSTSTAACASTSCSPPRRSPSGSRGPSSTATPARAPGPSDHAPVIVDLRD